MKQIHKHVAEALIQLSITAAVTAFSFSGAVFVVAHADDASSTDSTDVSAGVETGPIVTQPVSADATDSSSTAQAGDSVAVQASATSTDDGTSSPSVVLTVVDSSGTPDDASSSSVSSGADASTTQGTMTSSSVPTSTQSLSLSTLPNVTLSVSYGSNGSISPSGSITVPYGDTQTFTLSPDPGYQVASVTVGGVPMDTHNGALSGFQIYPTVSESVTVTFQPIPPPPASVDYIVGVGTNGSTSYTLTKNFCSTFVLPFPYSLPLSSGTTTISVPTDECISIGPPQPDPGYGPGGITVDGIIQSSSVNYSAPFGQSIGHTIVFNFTPIPLIVLNGSSTVDVQFGGTYTELGATATDTVTDAPITVTISGDTVDTSVIGSYHVRYDAVDSAGKHALEAVRTVNVVPASQTISFGALPDRSYGDADFAVSATSSANLPVSFSATGACTISGDLVHLATAGSCSVTASQGGDTEYAAAADVTQTFTIKDVTSPVIASSTDIVAEATSSAGASVTYIIPSATDDVDGSVMPTCVPASGSTFHLGTTTVECTATDQSGNTSTSTFSVAVRDTTPPVVTLNGSSTIELTVGNTYTEQGASAYDLVDGTTTVTISGNVDTSLAGAYILTYSSADAAGNSTSTTREIIVNAPAPLPPSSSSGPSSSSSGNVPAYGGFSAVPAIIGSFIQPQSASAAGNAPADHSTGGGVIADAQAAPAVGAPVGSTGDQVVQPASSTASGSNSSQLAAAGAINTGNSAYLYAVGFLALAGLAFAVWKFMIKA